MWQYPPDLPPQAEKRVGHARVAGAYAWHRFRRRGSLALRSDFPVELSDPRLGLFAAIARTDR